jgi:hypothetical protein
MTGMANKHALMMNFPCPFPLLNPLMEQLAIRLGTQACKSLVIPQMPSPQSSPASGRGGKRERQLLIPAGEEANEPLRDFHIDHAS